MPHQARGGGRREAGREEDGEEREGEKIVANLRVLILKLCYPLLVGEFHVLSLVQQFFIAPPVHLHLHGELIRDLSSLVQGR